MTKDFVYQSMGLPYENNVLDSSKFVCEGDLSKYDTHWGSPVIST